jgi:alanyl-tRNA synthetase
MSRAFFMYRDNMPSLASIRSTFLDHFAGAGHAVLASSPLVPHDDPTLLFTNAGMVQFKNLFTGAETPKVPRAATSQKCVRAGGKHNDLDNVGYTARHHTFFEMLGNFSFGDYFKDEAISLAWSLISKTFGLQADRLLVTVYADDEEAAALWRKIAGFPDEKIIRIASSDNFWSMGDTGPCGPCSEIFYDHGPHIPGGPPGSPDQDGDRWVEVWNLVFMQFEQFADGRRAPLPKPSIDTGMGLERIAAVLQGVHNNYDVDLFRTLIEASESLTGVKAEGERAPSHRVIADHLRAMSFLIADGVTPSNEGRGYVLRRIMRRAMRHAHLLGASEPLLHRLAPTLIGQMGPAFPELNRAEALILATLEQEEVRFRRTLGRGLDLLGDAAADLKAGDALPGETAFRLYDTYGFPLDLTQDVLRARDIGVDLAGFDAAMARQKAEARAAWAGSGAAGTDAIWFDLKERIGATEFLGYTRETGAGVLKAIIRDGVEQAGLAAGDSAELIFDQTPFYAESGGQAGDAGTIRIGDAVFEVADTKKRAGALHGHVGKLLSGTIAPGAEARLEVDHRRRSALRANHSATHLLHAALRDALGAHVTQKGSLVEADRLRFDFAHGQAVTPEQLRDIERQVNAVIRQNGAAETRLMAPEDAIAAGAMALFGEKYGEEVRVLSMGERAGPSPYSVELCGGTHVTRTGDIGAFAILSEGAVAAGVRRIEAATGDAALDHLRGLAAFGQNAAERLKTPLPELEDRVAALLEARKGLEKELAEARKKLALAGDGGAPAAGPETVAGVAYLARTLAGVSAKDLRGLVEEARDRIGSGIVAFAADADGKLALVVGVTPDLTATHRAGDLIRAATQAIGGQGGGKPDMAQGGGPDPSRAADALAAVRAALEAAAAPA